MAEKNRTASNEEIANFTPAIDKTQMVQMESSAASQERGVQRRVVLGVLTASADNLSKLSIENPDAFKEALECAEAFAAHSKALADVADTAVHRLNIADARPAAKGGDA